MSIKSIIQREHKVLRAIAKSIPIREIKTPKTKKVLDEMSASLASQDDGVAIAAPQIGRSLRIFVVSGKVFDKNFGVEREEKLNSKEKLVLTISKKTAIIKNKDVVFINPKITKLSRDKDWLPEGCLSVRWLYGKSYRSKKATVEAYDENGKKFTRGASGLLAQIFQHETDHLDGILFIDHAKELKEENPPR